MEATTKAIIDGYMEKAKKKLEVAGKLLKSGDYEDAVSRAYYADLRFTILDFRF